MSAQIPQEFVNLLTERVFYNFTTIMPDGQPQSSVVWGDYDGEYILINSARGRRKDRNIAADPRVNVLVFDPANPYRYLEVRGEVVEITEDGAVEMIHSMAQKYEGKPYYGGYVEAARAERETRVTYKIKPTKVITHG